MDVQTSLIRKSAKRFSDEMMLKNSA